MSWGTAAWQVLAASAPFFLFGLVLAGVVRLVLNERTLNRLLGTGRTETVLRAALIGVPLPLCSCSVLPVAEQLRRSGLSRGGTVSFLISTPESSIDSILLTWSLTDPVLTVARPLAAFLTATAAGLLESRFDKEKTVLTTATEPVTCVGCDCHTEPAKPERPEGWWQRVREGQMHAFTTLMSDLAPYLFVGYLLAGLAAVLFGSPLEFSGGGAWWPYLSALIIGVPLYVCATSSTPLAAVLLGAGFPPGAILVFLMVGPATNLATLSVTRKMLGVASTLRYLGSIVVVSLALGLLLDHLYDWISLVPDYRPGSHGHEGSFIYTTSAVVLALLIVFYSGRHIWRKYLRR